MSKKKAFRKRIPVFLTADHVKMILIATSFNVANYERPDVTNFMSAWANNPSKAQMQHLYE
jgi:hypothetical protein